MRWTTDRDGYTACGTCYSKLGSNPICTDCFCSNCYTSVAERCPCLRI